MKLIELHVLQSFPVSCMNRDDVGSPKSAIFGGVNRARISSQCMKRAIREFAQAQFPSAQFNAQRTRLIITPLQNALKKHGLGEEESIIHARSIADKLTKKEKTQEKDSETAKSAEKKSEPKSDDDGEESVSTLLFLSPAEIDALAKGTAEAVLKGRDYKKDLAKFCKSTDLKNAADIAFFGRMVAADQSLTLEGASMFSHAISTHRAESDLDFYTAIDDMQNVSDAGAGMMGTLEFNAAVYYRYTAINLDLLFSRSHLGSMTIDERKGVLDAFIRSTLMAVPGARKNSMNAHTLPGFVLGVMKEKGQPVQLVNAFEEPIFCRGKSILDASAEKLLVHHDSLKATWGISTKLEVAMPNKNLDTFCAELIAHVE